MVDDGFRITLRRLVRAAMMSSAVDRALYLAMRAHARQRDQAGEPCINHVIRVWERVKPLGEKHEVLALLHDTIESNPSDGMRDEIFAFAYDAGVAGELNVITRRPGQTYSEYLDFVTIFEIAIEVKLADIEDNLDPERMAKLPAAKRTSLTKRYQHAQKVLRRALAEMKEDTDDAT